MFTLYSADFTGNPGNCSLPAQDRHLGRGQPEGGCPATTTCARSTRTTTATATTSRPPTAFPWTATTTTRKTPPTGSGLRTCFRRFRESASPSTTAAPTTARRTASPQGRSSTCSFPIDRVTDSSPLRRHEEAGQHHLPVLRHERAGCRTLLLRDEGRGRGALSRSHEPHGVPERRRVRRRASRRPREGPPSSRRAAATPPCPASPGSSARSTATRRRPTRASSRRPRARPAARGQRALHHMAQRPALLQDQQRGRVHPAGGLQRREQLLPDDFSDVGQAEVLARYFSNELRYSPATHFIPLQRPLLEETEPGAQAVAHGLTRRQFESTRLMMEALQRLKAAARRRSSTTHPRPRPSSS